MKDALQSLLEKSLASLVSNGTLDADHDAQIHIERTRDEKHGDLATNLALTLAKKAGKNPRELAQQIIDHLPDSKQLQKCEIAGPGFINFFLSQDTQHGVIGAILEQGDKFGRSNTGKGRRVQVEFVSANPTGPLHVGHGRGAAYGATVADLLEAVGYDVHREYYVNDAGRQMDILAVSVWLRYLELGGAEFTFPSNGYKGDYVQDIAAAVRRGHGDTLEIGIFEVFDGVPADEPDGGDKELHIDGLIESAKTLLRDDQYRVVFDTGLNYILDDIRDDLEKFGVSYDEWYSERSLTDSGAVERALMRLREAGYVYEQGGAEWFKSTEFGDEKDRVVVRDNGQTTYFASDIAYHMDKLERGFDQVIDIWGADHHGYVPRVKAALKALGDDPDKLDVLLVQFAVLYRGGEKVQMSTRSGEFITLRQLRKDVGNDASRFFYVMRKAEQHLDFDLDLAKSQSKDNPLYYIQYAHARICSVMRELADKGFSHDSQMGLDKLDLLSESHELALMSRLGLYPELLERAALNHEPHQLVHYLRDLANDFHTYYNAHKALVDDDALRNARLVLFNATRQVLANGLTLLGVSAPEKM